MINYEHVTMYISTVKKMKWADARQVQNSII